MRSMFPDLPQSTSEIDIGVWDGLSPEELILKPSLVYEQPPSSAATRALKYSRVGTSDSYDELGFRLLAATPCKGPVTLQTIFGMRLERKWREASQMDPSVAALIEEHTKMRHRPIDLPRDGHFRYEVEGKFLHFTSPRENATVAGDQDVWTFPLSAPPSMIMEMAVPRDEPRVFAELYQVEIPGASWIPLARLVESGRFQRMQEWRQHLSSQRVSHCFYCFISHRWLSPKHPDPEPEPVQAALIAWQMFSHLCESIRIANERGLHEPRKFSPHLGFAVGVYGSGLAESLVVNLLRQALEVEMLEAAWKEVMPFEDVVGDYGVAAAPNDIGLARLRSLLADSPILAALIARIFLWYDYGCMPQSPRTGDDERLFRAGLDHLVAMQMVGQTAILLDEAEDYLSRGWCSLEAVVADISVGTTQLLVGSPRPNDASRGLTEHYFETLMQDRPHILWRALLDTELFRVQTAERCMARLNLAVTESLDLPLIYQGFQRLPAPLKIKIDDSEIVTGVFPLPVISDSRVLKPNRTGRSLSLEAQIQARHTLYWQRVLYLDQGWNEKDDATSVASYRERKTSETGKRSCHVVVIGGCEGEAVLFANWVWNRIEDLEQVTDSRVHSVSWLATDIAPVGHFIDGTLRALPVEADLWVIVTISIRLDYCGVTGIIQEMLNEAKLPYIELAIDVSVDNVCERVPNAPTDQHHAADDAHEKFDRPEIGLLSFPVHRGGLFRRYFLKHLL